MLIKLNALGFENSLRKKNDGVTFFGYQEENYEVCYILLYIILYCIVLYCIMLLNFIILFVSFAFNKFIYLL